VPATSHRVCLGNKNNEGLKLPLQGVSVGNGLTDPEIQYEFYAQMAYNYSNEILGHPIITLSDYQDMVAAWPSCHSKITQCQADTNACDDAQSFCNNAMFAAYENTGMNPYDIRIPCAVAPLCYDFGPVQHFLSNPDVMKKLGVTTMWSACNFEVNGMFSNDWMKNFQLQLPDMLNDGIRVLIYAGDRDFICNWIGNKAWTLAMPWAGHDDFNAAMDQPWNVDGSPAGLLRTAKNFTFLQVFNAGHMVPMDQPKNALKMLQQFMAGP